ncbi:MAG: hypothetical protein ACMG6S_02560, partial [Byssovorax sp.]
MSFTLILAVTAAVAGTMGYLAARKKSNEPEAPSTKRKDEKQNEHDEGEEKDEYGKPPPAVSKPKEKAAVAAKPGSKGAVKEETAEEKV